MNRDILNIILNDVFYNDINSIKKTSLISKNIHNNIQILAQTNEIKNKLCILDAYIDPNKCMSYAALNNHHYVVDIIQVMIGKGANNWNEVMCYAALYGNIGIVQLMIEKGANNWNLVMCCAAEGGHIGIVQLMIEKGAQRSMDWNMAMYCAAKNGHIDIVQLMIETGATDWNKAMILAAQCGHSDIVELLKQHQSLKN